MPTLLALFEVKLSLRHETTGVNSNTGTRVFGPILHWKLFELELADGLYAKIIHYRIIVHRSLVAVRKIIRTLVY